MLRLTASVCILLVAAVQDPAEKVRVLVEKMASEQIALRDEAARELVKLGPSALPAIRNHLAKSAGESKARLQKVVYGIERAEKVVRILAPAPTVTLKVQDRPAADVLAEISKQAGVRVNGTGLPGGTLFSIDAHRLPLHDAVDDLCRRHGKVMYEWQPGSVSIRPGEYRKLKTFDSGPFRFVTEGWSWKEYKGDDELDLILKGTLVGPPGRLPQGARLEFDVVKDDQGVDLGSTPPRTGFNLGDFEWSGAGPDALRGAWPLFRPTSRIPAEAATKLATCRGAVRLTFILEGRRLMTLKDPAAKGFVEEGPLVMSVKSWESSAGLTRVAYKVGLDKEDEEVPREPAAPPTWLAIHDKSGRRLEGTKVTEQALGLSSSGGIRYIVEGTQVFAVPAGFDVASIDLMEATDVEEIRIPFDLSGVALPPR